jgi:hypothetical protein
LYGLDIHSKNGFVAFEIDIGRDVFDFLRWALGLDSPEWNSWILHNFSKHIMSSEV